MLPNMDFIKAWCLTFTLLFKPSKFYSLEKEDSGRHAIDPNSYAGLTTEEKDRMDREAQAQDTKKRIEIIRQAFLYSLLLIIVCALVGYVAGWLTEKLIICASPNKISWVQIIGTCFLSWGTLFVRGWDIQTKGGNTLKEKVNQWIYRAQFCIGTFALVFSLAWTPCT